MRPLVAAFLIAFAGPGFAQSVQVLGSGGGTPAPEMTATLPALDTPFTVSLHGAPPNAPVYLVFSAPIDFPLMELAPGCHLWVDPFALLAPPFIGVTDGTGAYSLTFPAEVMTAVINAGPGAVFHIQAMVFSFNEGCLFMPWGRGFVTNALRITLPIPPDDEEPGVPETIITYIKADWGGSGPAGQLLTYNFALAFPSGFDVGKYHLASGATAPNGKRFTGAGLGAFRNYVTGGGGLASAFTVDTVNTDVEAGAGPLGRNVAGLIMNVRFHDLGMLNADPGLFGSLFYVNPGQPLHGATINEILAAAQNAVAGLGLPAGMSYASMFTLVEKLNASFAGGVASSWAANHLFMTLP